MSVKSLSKLKASVRLFDGRWFSGSLGIGVDYMLWYITEFCDLKPVDYQYKMSTIAIWLLLLFNNNKNLILTIFFSLRKFEPLNLEFDSSVLSYWTINNLKKEKGNVTVIQETKTTNMWVVFFVQINNNLSDYLSFHLKWVGWWRLRHCSFFHSKFQALFIPDEVSLCIDEFKETCFLLNPLFT